MTWSGIAVPAGTPKEMIARLNREIGAALVRSDTRQRLAELGAEAVGGAPEAFDARARAARDKWSRRIGTRNITIN